VDRFEAMVLYAKFQLVVNTKSFFSRPK